MMGGRGIDVAWNSTSPSNWERTLVLVGRTGNGKSATGNSILGSREFKSRPGSSGVTKTCQMRKTKLKDGQVVNVIDTPGLFDPSADTEFVSKEIVKCIDMAKDGIHAVLVVFSATKRFSQEEDSAVRSLESLFGKKIFDYMIVVFTGGDELEECNETLEDYLGAACPKPLKDILQLCGNRCVLFDNKTKDEAKRTKQVRELLSLVNSVNVRNGGQPYTNEIFSQLKTEAAKLRDQQVEVDSSWGYSRREISELKEQMQKSYEDKLKRTTEMVESRLLQQLAQERAARLKAEEAARLAQGKSNEEIGKLRENLERAQRETRELRYQYENRGCAIL